MHFKHSVPYFEIELLSMKGKIQFTRCFISDIYVTSIDLDPPSSMLRNNERRKNDVT